MTIRAIIFDLGGVLVRTEKPAQREALAEKLGMTRERLEAIVFSGESGRRAQNGEIEAHEHWTNIVRDVGVSEEEISDLQDQFWGGDRLDERLVEAIRRYKQEYTTALLSNAFSDLRRAIEEEWKMVDAFDEIFISAELGMTKPDPRIYRLVLDRLGVRPDEAVFVDDFVENVEGARSVGMHAIHFRSPDQALQDLDNLLAENRREEQA